VQLVALGTLPDLATRQEGAPLADSAALLVGAWAGLIMTVGAVISIEGNVGSSLLNGPRYLYALARDGYGPALLARVHPRYRTPAPAIVAQGGLAWALALSGSFTQLAMLSIVARLATYIGTAAAVPVLRRRLGMKPGAFVVPGGPLIPILALLLCLAFLASATADNLVAGAIGLAVGVAIYFTRRPPAPRGESA
jgi:amino acid transporter